LVNFGKIEKVDIKSIWPGEATHFTPWLSENIQELGNVLEMELEYIDSEVSAGGFSADILAKDIATNKSVVIENQYGNTDHKHLGQLLTYSSILNANAIVWIAESIRSEHKAAIDFLNSNLRESLLFYAVEVSLVKIDDSRPAYIFNVISKPTIKDEISNKRSSEISEGRERYRSFFQSLIDTLREKHRFTNAKAEQPQNWYTFASDNSKIYKYSVSFALGNRFRTEVYIDTGDKEKNESLFEYLYDQKEFIEKEFGNELEWEKLETKRACRIAIYIDGTIEDDTEYLEKVEVWAIENLLKMKKVFPNAIEQWINNQGDE
jgi:hypothetical protein